MADTDHTIVVADDDDEVRGLLSETLSAAGFRVETAADGRAALELISEVKPDLVVLDITMPHMTGHEVLHQLQKNLATRDIPVVFLTADSDQQSRLEGLKGGAIEYFDKPFDAIMLRRRIERILWKQDNEPSQA